VQFNLELSDPIGEPLQHRSGWRGVGGNYRLLVGEQSTIEAGKDERFPTLRAQIGAFTRMWMGAQRASALTLTDGMEGPVELIEALDRVFHIPEPHIDWDF
jgi:hypothetical protein